MSSKVESSNESPTQKADDVRPPFDGPHKPNAKKHSKKKTETGPNGPAYVVSVKDARKDEVKSPPLQYNPKVLKETARSYLNSSDIDSSGKNTLREILGPEDKET